MVEFKRKMKAKKITKKNVKNFLKLAENGTLTIPGDVSIIDEEAFCNVDFSEYEIETIIVPETVITVGKKAFSNATFGKIVFCIDSYGNNFLQISAYAFWLAKGKECRVGNANVLLDPNAFKESSFENIIFFGQVTEIPKCTFWGCDKLKSFIIPSGCTDIEENAFAYCKSLKSIQFPNEAVYLGERAFYNSGLEDVMINSGLIQKDCFMDCLELKNVDLFDTICIDDGAFKNCRALTNVSVTSSQMGKSFEMIEIGAESFGNCESLKSLNFDCKIFKIGRYAFENCVQLEEIDVSECFYIPESAFENAEKLKSVNLRCVENIRSHAFKNCKSLENVILGNSLKTIDAAAFSECVALKNITIPQNVDEIGKWAFESCGLEKVEINSKWLIKLAEGIFSDCNSLKEVVIRHPETLKYLEDGCFEKCYVLKTIPFFTNVKTIGSNSFYRCETLTEFRFGKKLTEIKNSAFKGCRNIKEFVVPANVREIYDEVFNSCYGLEKITLPKLNFVGTNIFTECDNLKKIEFI